MNDVSRGLTLGQMLVRVLGGIFCDDDIARARQQLAEAADDVRAIAVDAVALEAESLALVLGLKGLAAAHDLRWLRDRFAGLADKLRGMNWAGMRWLDERQTLSVIADVEQVVSRYERVARASQAALDELEEASKARPILRAILRTPVDNSVVSHDEELAVAGAVEDFRAGRCIERNLRK